jgi:DNA-binding transcriptional ArsR family regulator
VAHDKQQPEQSEQPDRNRQAERPEQRVIDATSLHGLAHPLRVQLWDELAVHGPATASMLARKLGESSGATSYHLRQLEKHGFVEEDPDRGTGRERWWRLPRGGTTLNPTTFDSPASRQAARLVAGEIFRGRETRLRKWMNDFDLWPREWIDASVHQTVHARLRPEELAALTAALGEFVDQWLDKYRDRQEPDLVDVELQIDAFPVAEPPQPPSEQDAGDGRDGRD